MTIAAETGAGADEPEERKHGTGEIVAAVGVSLFLGVFGTAIVTKEIIDVPGKSGPYRKTTLTSGQI
jgi:hypothetical protein